MAQWSALWKTAAVGAVGDQEAGYTEAHWSVIGRILAGCANFEGVAAGYANELEVTDVGGGDVEVDTGGAVVDGKVYNNTAAVTVNIPTPGAGTERIDRIVLRCSWAGYGIRVTRIAGVAGGAPAVPAITQTSGTTYDITLYQARITDGGVITLTDERTWALPNSTNTRTRYMFVQAVGGINVTASSDLPFYVAGATVLGFGIVLPDGVQSVGIGSFTVPADFVSGLTVKAVVASDSSGNCYASQECDYGADGENVALHTASGGGAPIAIVGGKRTAIASAALTSAAIGDYVNLRLGRLGGDANDTVNDDVFLAGWLVTYTADS